MADEKNKLREDTIDLAISISDMCDAIKISFRRYSPIGDRYMEPPLALHSIYLRFAHQNSKFDISLVNERCEEENTERIYKNSYERTCKKLQSCRV